MLRCVKYFVAVHCSMLFHCRDRPPFTSRGTFTLFLLLSCFEWWYYELSCIRFCLDMFLFHLNEYAGVELQNHMIMLCLTPWGTAKLFSRVTCRIFRSPQQCILNFLWRRICKYFPSVIFLLLYSALWSTEFSALMNPHHLFSFGACALSVSEARAEPRVAQTLLLRLSWLHLLHFSPAQSLSRVRLFATPWTAACQASLSITCSCSSLKLMSIESVMPPNHLTLCRPLLFLPSTFPRFTESFPVNQFFISGGQILQFQLQHQCFQWIFRTDFLSWLDLHGTLKSLLQHHSSKVSILWHSSFFIVQLIQLSRLYMNTGKTIALARWNFVDKVMSLLFSILSRLIIAFFPRSKCLLISWLQSPSAVIFNLVILHLDFWFILS